MLDRRWVFTSAAVITLLIAGILALGFFRKSEVIRPDLRGGVIVKSTLGKVYFRSSSTDGYQRVPR